MEATTGCTFTPCVGSFASSSIRHLCRDPPPVLWTGKTKCGRVFICLGRVFICLGRVWTGKFFLKFLCITHCLQNVGLLRALYTSCYCHYIGICVFHEHQRDICRRRAYSQGFAKAVHMSNDRQHFEPA